MRTFRTAFLVGHKMKSSAHLYEIAQRYKKELPPGLQWGTDYDNTKLLSYEETGSKLKVDTAKDEDLGKSETIHYLHLSERAYVENEKCITSIKSSVPKKPDTIVIEESTGNRFGDPFHEEWKRAKEGVSAYIPVFIAWWEHEDYRMPVPEGFQISAPEQKMMLLYNLDMEQIVWYRDTFENECKGNIDDMHKYYPSNDIEPFIASGQLTFKSSIEYQQEIYILNDSIGHLTGELVVSEKTKEIEFVDNPFGWLKIWDEPDDRHKYVIGADTAEGIAAEKDGSNPDYDAGVVKSVRTGERWKTVATIHERVDPDVFAYHSYLVALYYRRALIFPEINTYGREYVKRLLNLKYKNIWYSKEKSMSGRSVGVSDYGWRQNGKTRKELIAFQREALRKKWTEQRDKICILEHTNFITNKHGKDEAAPGGHDDFVIADSLATMGCNLNPYTPHREDRERKTYINRR